MSFEVTTANRLAARKLLTKCGVRPEHARAMALRQLKEHLENFVTLGIIPLSTVKHELESAASTNAAEGAPNCGQPWTAQMDEELREHYRLGQRVETLAALRGRTVGAINIRLVQLGVLRYDRQTNRYEEVPQATDNEATRAGQFADEGAIEALDAAWEQEKRDRHERNKDIVEAAKKLRADMGASPPVTVGETLAGGMPVADAALVARVSTLEHCEKAHAARLGKLSQDYTYLQQAIADTIAAEVKRIQGAWQKFEIHTGDKVHKIEGLAHKAFPKLLRAVSARTRHDKGALNIWLYGPAGTGKSTAARKLAEAFSLAFHTNGPVGSQWDIRGFTDAQGKIVETAFRRAWINGGVYCWDEGDGSAPAALIEANGALATGFASFPDGVFQRHPDCIVIINGNLRPGAAPDATYNGRYKQDTAFVNRFVAIEWGIDEDLERALLGKLDAIGEQWLKFVRELRKKITARGIKGIVVSPRQLQYGIALLDAGAELDEVMDQTVKFMFTDDQWLQVVASETKERKYA